MNTIKYHKATDKDIESLVESRIEFLSEYWGKQEVSVENKLREELFAFFRTEFTSQNYITWIAKSDDLLVGIGGMKIIKKPGSFRIPNGTCGYIMNMYTVPAYRKQGIAKAILDKLIASGQEMGITFFELHATKEGEPLYKNNGFEIHGEPTYRKFITTSA